MAPKRKLEAVAAGAPAAPAAASKKRVVRREVEEESDDDDDTGSDLQDFIVPDDDSLVADAPAVQHSDEADEAEIIKQLPAVASLGTTYEGGVRRSTRANKGKPPVVYVDEDYAKLMLEGEDPEEVFDDDDEEEEEEEACDDEDEDCNADGGPDAEATDEDYTDEEEEEDDDDGEEEENETK